MGGRSWFDSLTTSGLDSHRYRRAMATAASPATMTPTVMAIRFSSPGT